MTKRLTNRRVDRAMPPATRWTAAGLCAGAVRHRARCAATVVISLSVAGGCAQPLSRGTINPQEQVGFRTEALRVLAEAALSSVPTQRMNAIEALGEVAPNAGLRYIALNIENDYPGASFAALMALGTLRNADFIERIRTRAEHPDANVKIAALYALHRLGDKQRTGELSDYLLKHRDARVRANAALAIGRLEEPSSVKLLRRALKNERKDLPKLQILEALAFHRDDYAIERLLYDGYSSYPDQATLAIMFLGNVASDEAEDLFRDRLHRADFPEVRLAAVRGLGRLGYDDGLNVALEYLWFNTPKKNWPKDPPQQQIARVRGLAALALEAIGSPDALLPLREAFELEGQPPYARLAIARAAIRIINLQLGLSTPTNRDEFRTAQR